MTKIILESNFKFNWSKLTTFYFFPYSTYFLLFGVEGRGIDYGRQRFITNAMIPAPPCPSPPYTHREVLVSLFYNWKINGPASKCLVAGSGLQSEPYLSFSARTQLRWKPCCCQRLCCKSEALFISETNFKFRIFSSENWISRFKLQANFGGIWVRFQTTKIKQVTRKFWFPSAYESYVYTIPKSVKCAIALFLKKPGIYLNWKILYCQKKANHHLSLWEAQLNNVCLYMKFLWFHLYKILFTNKWFTKIRISWYLSCNDKSKFNRDGKAPNI